MVFGVSLAVDARADDSAPVVVHVSGAPTSLVIQQKVGNLWTSVCEGSCDTPLDASGTYRMTSEGEGSASKPFDLGVPPGSHVAIAYNRPASKGHRAGVALTVVGATFLGLSFATALATGIVIAATDGMAALLLIPGGFVSVLTGIVGTATLVPGLVLMLSDHPHPRALESHDGAHALPVFGLRF